MTLANKLEFKKTCEEIGLRTAPWIGGNGVDDLATLWDTRFCRDEPVLVKASNGTGGMALGGICRVGDYQDLLNRATEVERLAKPIIAEKLVDIAAEVSIHWEMDEDGTVRIFGIFDQLAQEFSYAGTAFPAMLSFELEDQVRNELMEVFVPYLQQMGAVGFYCCDILIDRAGVIYWTDFNPRKGAIVYVHDFVRRLADNHFDGSRVYYFWHEHTHHKIGSRFCDLQQVLGELLTPSMQRPFVVLTNLGIIAHGGA
jgi:phosphoribosylaminoimidazole carboxylase (NCAIR synthetase)